MKKIIKWAAVVIFVALAGIQFIRPQYSNPPINQEETLQATTQVPENVDAILVRSCNDCHTNNTRYPWYSNIAPLSWSVVDHINDGRRHLNFSVWNTYDQRKKRQKLDQVCGEVTDKAMPIGQYLWVHRDALLSEEDVKTLCGWTQQERDRLAAAENK
jgi:hypothetical protein